MAATEIHTREVEGVTLRWRETGEGPTVVLLHGLSENHRTWTAVSSRLSRTHRVLALDLPRAAVDDPAATASMLAWHARMLDRWLEQLGEETVDVVGHSYGGGVAQWLLLENRARVRRLGLVSSGGLGAEVTPWLRLAAVPHLLERLGEPAFRVGARLSGRFGGASMRTLTEWMREHGQRGAGDALYRTLRDVIGPGGQRRSFFEHAHTVPELPPMRLFWGARDAVIPVAHGRRAARALRHCDLVLFDGVGHLPQRECPRVLATALLDFLEAEALPSSVLDVSPETIVLTKRERLQRAASAA